MSSSPQQAQPLPWLDRPFAELVRLSWPVTVSMLSFSVMTLVDTLLVGRLGTEELAGVGLGGTIAFALISFGFGLVRGGKTLVSQAVGAGRGGEAGGYRGAALLGGVAFGLVAIALAWPMAHALAARAATHAQGEHFRAYLMARSLGAPSAMIFAALREVRYGEGDSRSPMIASVVANGCNMVLAYVLIFPLRLGVTGAGLATAIAQTIEAAVLALSQSRRGWGVRATRGPHLIALLRIGLPTGLQMMLEVGAFALLAAMIASMHPAQMAAHQITLQIISFSFLPAFGVGESAAVMVGQAVGAARDDLVMPIARLTVRTVGIYTGLCSLLCAALAPQLVGAFTRDPEALAAGIRLVHVSVLFLAMDGANIVARSVLRGTGDVAFPAWVGVICSWALTPPLAWLLGFRLHLLAFGGWLGLSAEVFLGAAIQWVRLWRGGWRPFAAKTRAEVLAIAAGS